MIKVIMLTRFRGEVTLALEIDIRDFGLPLYRSSKLLLRNWYLLTRLVCIEE
jgi:hypothetical protein